MPLSEHEERILAEIERQLAAEDPRFVSRSRRRRLRPSANLRSWSPTFRLRLAIGLAIVGVMNVLGLVLHIAFGAVGLTLILLAILVGGSAIREQFEPDVPRDEHR